MANAVMTESTFASSGVNIIMTWIADEFIRSLRSRVRVLNYMKNVSAKLQGGGDTVRVPIAPTISSNLLADGNAVSLDDTAGTVATVTINKHRYVSYGETLMAIAKTANTPQMAMEMESRLDGLFNDIEADVLTVVTSGFVTNVQGTYNSNLTEATIVAAMGSLFSSKVPQDRPLIGFVHPDGTCWQALAQIATFAQAQMRGFQEMSPILANGNPLTYANMIPWHGAWWNMTQSVNKSGTNHDNVIIYPDSIAVAFREIPIPDPSTGVSAANFVDSDSSIAFQICRSWNKDRLAEEITIHTLYGYATGRESWGCLVKG